jgi:hypothetical protein
VDVLRKTYREQAIPTGVLKGALNCLPDLLPDGRRTLPSTPFGLER